MKKLIIITLITHSIIAMNPSQKQVQQSDDLYHGSQDLMSPEQQKTLFFERHSLSPSDEESIHPWQSPRSKSVEPQTPRPQSRKRDLLPPLITPEQAKAKENSHVKSIKRPHLLSPLKSNFPDNKALFAAVERGDCNYIHSNEEKNRSFIKNKNQAGDTLLHVAVRTCNEDMIKLLLELKADPSLPNKNGITPLQLAEQKVAQTKAEMDAHEDYDLFDTIYCEAVLRILQKYDPNKTSEKSFDSDSIYNYLSD